MASEEGRTIIDENKRLAHSEDKPPQIKVTHRNGSRLSGPEPTSCMIVFDCFDRNFYVRRALFGEGPVEVMGHRSGREGRATRFSRQCIV